MIDDDIKKSDLPKLKSDKQYLFVKYYCQLLNATRAAIKAGYEFSSARQYGSDLKADPYISIHIKYHLQELHKTVDLESEDILREVKSIGFSRITDFLDGASEEELEAIDPENFESAKEYEQELGYKTGSMKIKPIHAMGESIAALDELSINPKNGTITDLKTKGKLKALELLGKHKGLWNYEQKSGGRDREANVERIRSAIRVTRDRVREREKRKQAKSDSGES